MRMGIPDPPMECGKAGRSWLWGAQVLKCENPEHFRALHMHMCKSFREEMNVFGQVVNAERPIANRLVAFRESEQQVDLLARYGQATKPIATKRLNMVPILLDEKSPNGMEM